MPQTKTFQHLRNSTVYNNLAAAQSALQDSTFMSNRSDGEIVLARYKKVENDAYVVYTLVGIYHKSGNTTTCTFIQDELVFGQMIGLSGSTPYFNIDSSIANIGGSPSTITAPISNPDEKHLYIDTNANKIYRYRAETDTFIELVSTETDPIFTASAAYGITSSDITNWDGKVDSTTKINDFALSSDITLENIDFGQCYVTCSTAANTAAKSANKSGFVLMDGGIVSVKFTYNVNAGATLNINSTGAYPIYYKGAAITNSAIFAGEIATFMFDETNHRYQFLCTDTIRLDKVILGKIANGDFYQGSVVLGQWAFLSDPYDNPTRDKLYVDVLTDKIYFYNEATLGYEEIGGGTVDSSITSGGTNPVQGGAIYTALSNKEDKVTVVTVSTSGAVSQSLDPNKFYKFTGSPTSLTLTFNSGTELAVYAGKFTAGTGFSGLTITNSGVTVAPGAPTIEASKSYEFNMADNVILIVEV